ncbi:MAG: hypothetical protein QOG43_843 [Actinomycetota bacterium]|jgi:hypothetical protein|nr:hypothetical protein [Actinomycetota bacterium]
MSPVPTHASPETALLPEARAVFADLVTRSLDHRWALHHCSSQAFALNLFAPLGHQPLCAVLARVGLPVSSVERIDFEYSDPADRFGEIRPRSAHQTQIDVVVRGTSAAGDRLVALIEVKFTETDFGHCSAYQNPANPRHDVCRSPGLFGGEPAACFQLANHGDGRRTYYDHLAKIPVVPPSGAGDAGGCLVRESLSQPMRSLALAHLLLNAGEADRVAYVLCAPAQHPTIWRRFTELRAAFPDADGRTIRPLTAEDVAGLHADGGTAFTARYPIGAFGGAALPDPVSALADNRSAKEPVDILDPLLSTRFEEALVYTARVHGRHARKGGTVPYVSHLLAVASLVMEDGGGEDEAIAALLHDAIEDQGVTAHEIAGRFGETVAAIVVECSGPMGEESGTWRVRKQVAIDQVAGATPGALRVEAADKVHNARAILADYRRVGEGLWSRFNAPDGRDDILWYYREMAGAFRKVTSGFLVDELERVVEELAEVTLVAAIA